MQCKKCGSEYTPLNCPSCGKELGDGVCPSCSENGIITCSNCQNTIQIRRADAQPSAGNTPPPVNEGIAFNTPPSPQPMVGYQGYVAPTEKVKLGGWLMAFTIVNALLLLYNAGTIVYQVFTTSLGIGTLIFSVAVNIIPYSIMLYQVSQRNKQFKIWFIIMLIIQAILTVISSLSYFLISAMPSMVGENADVEAAMALLPENYELQMLLSILFMVVLLISQIAWLVYLIKSKRVAYTFDPLNNPPKANRR